jgi:hypothetical protein
MPLEMSWQQPNRVVYQRFHGTITIEEIHDGELAFVAYAQEGEGPVHLIVDLREVQEYPKSMNQLRKGLSFAKVENRGQTVIIAQTNPAIRFIVSTIMQTLAKAIPFTFSISMEEAMRYLHERDDTVTIEQTNV